MGRDIVAAAKEFEDHAKNGYVPDVLARELHSLNAADRLAIAKQIDWDTKHQSDPSLPKIEFYDSGDLKSVDTSGKSGSTEWAKHVQLDKDKGSVRVEVNEYKSSTSYDASASVEMIEHDASGHLTRWYSSTTEIFGSKVTVTTSDDNWSYDAKTGNKVSHDSKSSSGGNLHEEYDANTGKEKFADETSSKGSIHRAYDSSTGKLQQEKIDNADKTHETITYDSNGIKVSREKQYGDHGDKGTREWIYDKKTGKEVYSEWRSPDGEITRSNIDADGHWQTIER
ncbi:MAG TPA: hypothetical protein V6C89_08845 [Drouetiella sp.]